MGKFLEFILNWLSFLFGSKTVMEEYDENETVVEEDAEEEEVVDEVPVCEENSVVVYDEPEEPKYEAPVVCTPVEEEQYKKMVILLDNGHARCTPGKRSPKLPDGSQFFEYEFNRDVVKRIAQKLDAIGIENHILVPEVDTDVALSTRAARANQYCCKYGAANCFFISVHVNAAGNGDWKNARGWSVYTTKGVTKSDEYATILYEEAERMLPNCGMTLRSDRTDGDPDYEEDFTVIYKAQCPAVLTENLFMDNMTDVQFLMSDGGRDLIAQIHVNAIKRIAKK